MKRIDNSLSSTPIPIAFVIHSMRVGGAERSVARLVNALDHERFQPLVICLTCSGPAADWIESSNVPVIEIKKSKRTDLFAVLRLARLLRAHQVKLIHSYNWGTLVESTLARRCARVAVHVHAERGTVLGQLEFRGLRLKVRGMLAGWAMRRCDAVVTNSRSVALRINERCGYPAECVRVIPNGVEAIPLPDPAHSSKMRFSLKIDESATILGSVGRLAPVKGFEIAIKAIADLCSAGGNYHLVLVGDGPEKASLQALAIARNVAKRVHLVGFQEQVANWLCIMDIYLNTSHSEGMSQSLVEAMSASRPVIATNVGDSSFVIGVNSEFGVLIEAGNVAELVRTIKKLSNPEVRKHFAYLAQQRHTDEFSINAMAAQYQLLYESALLHHSRISTEQTGLR